MFSCVFLIILLAIFIPKVAYENWAMKIEKERQKKDIELSKQEYQQAKYLRDHSVFSDEWEWRLRNKIQENNELKEHLLNIIKRDVGDYNYSLDVLALVYCVENKIMQIPRDFAEPGVGTFLTTWTEYSELEREVYKWYDNGMRENGYPYKLLFRTDKECMTYKPGTWVQDNPPIAYGVYYFEPFERLVHPTSFSGPRYILDMSYKEIQNPHRVVDTDPPL